MPSVLSASLVLFTRRDVKAFEGLVVDVGSDLTLVPLAVVILAVSVVVGGLAKTEVALAGVGLAILSASQLSLVVVLCAMMGEEVTGVRGSAAERVAALLADEAWIEMLTPRRRWRRFVT